MAARRNAATPCRLIIDRPLLGAWNMAVDEALLADAADHGLATLRLYQWNEPTLSLGYFQAYTARHQHAASRNCAIVRRQSGGGAILHDRELTYSIVLPADHPLARESQCLYTIVHNVVTTILAPQLSATGTNWQLKLSGPERELAASAEPFLCFQRRARGDLLLEQKTESGSPADWKILGSAQRRHRGAILQHGSLLLDRSPAAPELPGFNDVAGTQLTADNLSAPVSTTLAQEIGLSLAPQPLAEEIRTLAAKIESEKYANPGWTNRR